MPTFLGITGPFASGKTEIVKRLEQQLGWDRIVTCTTRPRREGEVDGIHYHFVDRDTFLERKRRGYFLETAEVNGELYGTPRESVEKAIESGEDIVASLDIQGIESLRFHPNENLRNAFISFYIEVGFAEAIRRARSRPGGMSFSELKRRSLTRFAEEQKKHLCDYRIPNPDGALKKTVSTILRIVGRRLKEELCGR